MSVRDRRRAPFCWLELDALDLIAENVPEAHINTARSVYLGLAQMAARQHDGHHDGFEASRRELAALSGVSLRTLDAYAGPEGHLATLGLLRVERQAAANGASRPSLYVLTTPGEPDPGPSEKQPDEGGATIAPPPVQPLQGEGAAGGATVAPPTRAGETAVKKEEELLPLTPQAGEAKEEAKLKERAARADSGSRRKRDLAARRALAAAKRAAAEAAKGEPDQATDEITAGWQLIRGELEQCESGRSGGWANYLRHLELAGVRGTELVLHTPARLADFTRSRYGSLIEAAARYHLANEAITIALIPTGEAEAA